LNLLRKLLFSSHPNRDEDICQLERKLQYTFKDPSILKRALTHRSLYSEPEKNYERLEFLGDAVLDHVVSEWLFNKFKTMDEGQLTKKRASLVNRIFLGMLGQKLGLVDHIIIDSGVDIKDQKVLKNLSADIYESILGAIFLDGGEKSAIKFIHTTLIHLKDHADENSNYKGTLIELSHRKGFNSPLFELINSKGPEHDKIFHIRVKLSNGETYDGTGQSKKAAEQNAAKMALESIKTN
jgi:ribonuclease-3